MSSLMSKVRAAYVLCVLHEVQPASLAFRGDKIANGSEKIFTLLHKQTSIYPRKWDIMKYG